ncbi:MAG: hypothetical protein CMF12_08820 [Idiomarina sp.]|uniref:TrbI/VirB10 family protein n=1 Tax=Idiomarina sp. TaxID=1874361 RepID=UPI000C5D101E|nr:TrbI/VirB10 family protein [Idiomarina sp.]MBT42613.1 hypothetical protein [Idiomarina sp.]
MAINADSLKDFVSDNKWVKPVIIGILGIGAMTFIASSMFGDDVSKRIPSSELQSRSYLGLESDLGAIDQKEAEGIVEEMKIRLEDKERSLSERYKADSQEMEQMRMEQEQLKNQLFELQKKLNQSNQVPDRELSVDDVRQMRGTNIQGNGYSVQGGPNTQPNVKGNVVRRPQTEIITESPTIEGNVIRTITQRSIREVQRSGEVTVSDIKVNRLTEETQSVDDQRESSQRPNRDNQNPSSTGEGGEFTLAMGSLISGTLINGVAAPTKVGSSDTPVPVLMRIKRSAIMPNHFSLDIRECMMLGSAIGDLASERVMVRAEALSCITNDGQAIEKKINAYAVSSSDGLTGIRGTVIERSGKAIMNSVKAGFLSGFGEAAAPQQVPSLNTNPEATSVWQSQNLNKYAGAGMLEGASSAMERVASYYLAIAEAMWPVIEVPAGIELDFIVQRGVTLQLNDTSEVVEIDEEGE